MPLTVTVWMAAPVEVAVHLTVGMQPEAPVPADRDMPVAVATTDMAAAVVVVPEVWDRTYSVAVVVMAVQRATGATAVLAYPVLYPAL